MRGSEILKSMGTIKDVYVNSRLVARGGIDKGYCSGFVFEVFFRAWGAAQGAQWPTTSALSTRNWRQFQKDFYGVDGNRQTFVNALTSRNMGTKVSIDEAKPGDLVQYWRNNNTGHSGIFKEIVRELDGSPGSLIIFGLNRNGLGNREEIIGTGRSQVNISEIFIVRPTVR